MRACSNVRKAVNSVRCECKGKKEEGPGFGTGSTELVARGGVLGGSELSFHKQQVARLSPSIFYCSVLPCCFFASMRLPPNMSSVANTTCVASLTRNCGLLQGTKETGAPAFLRLPQHSPDETLQNLQRDDGM